MRRSWRQKLSVAALSAGIAGVWFAGYSILNGRTAVARMQEAPAATASATREATPSATPERTSEPFPEFTQNERGESCVALDKLNPHVPDLEWCVSSFFGQPNLRETMINRIVPSRAFHAGGVHVDSSQETERIYVVDSGNNRILGFLGTEMSADRDADIVIGQPSLWDSGTCNGNNTVYAQPTAETLCFLPFPYVQSTLESARSSQLATDREGNLYVADLNNNRVLMYLDPFRTDSDADAVWGQPDFTSRACNRDWNAPDADSLCLEWPSPFSSSPTNVFAAGVALDGEGNLWVADSGNHRLLRFPRGSSVADIVLGQQDFSSSESNCAVPESGKPSLESLCKPVALAVHPSGELYVVDGELPGRARVLVYAPPFASGMPAERQLGLAERRSEEIASRIPHMPPEDVALAGAGPLLPATGLQYPRGIAIDPAGRVWVADVHNSRVVLLDDMGNIVQALGQPDEETVGCLGRAPFPVPGGDLQNLCFPNGEISFDRAGALYVSDNSQASMVVRFPAESLLNEPWSDGVLLYRGWNQVSALTLHNTHGFSVAGEQLIVSDAHRLLVWDDYLSLPAGAPATRVLGQDDFESNAQQDGQGFPGLSSQWVDADDRLWVTGPHDIYVFQTPLAGSDRNQPEPLAVLRSEDITWKDTGKPVVFETMGITYDSANDALWLVDWPRNRVLRVRGALGDDPLVDLILGQPDRANRDARSDRTSCNAGEGYENPQPYGLCSPRFVTLDGDGNLYVIDGSFELNGNRRVLEWDAETIASAEGMFPLLPADRVFAKPDFWTRECEDGQPCNPTGITFDQQGRMVMTVDGYGNHQYQRVFVYLHPLESQQPDYVFPFAFGQAAAAQFDQHGNLLLQDHTWNRLLLIRQPGWPE